MKIKYIFFIAVLLSLMAQLLIPIPFAHAAFFSDAAQFITDVTVPDGTTFAPGAAFIKTWRLKNTGNNTWTTSYSVVFMSGDLLGAATSVNMPYSVAPGQMVDISVPMTTPLSTGSYRGYWQLRNASGALFGIGWNAAQQFWVDINVTDTSLGVAYDFVANYCSATWTSGDGVQPCPGVDKDARGYVYKVDMPQYEDGYIESNPGLMVGPQNVYNGYIQGVYPAFTVQAGDRFQTAVSCAPTATSCYVSFRLQYQIGSGPVYTQWVFREKWEGKYYRADIDLSNLAGQTINFILQLDSYGYSTGDQAIWGMPRIVRGAGTVVTPTPVTLTPTTTLPVTLTPTTVPPVTTTPTSTAVPGYSACDRALFITDVTIPDGSVIQPGAQFVKTWRLKNTGTCTWTTAYQLVQSSGTVMGSSSAFFPTTVMPGQTGDLTVTLTAPSAAGNYRGYWLMKNNLGQLFGIGSSGTSAFWVDINVPGTGSGTSGYDFYANACSATWSSAAGILPCPGSIGNLNGYVSQQATPAFENGTAQSQPGLVVGPQAVYNGYIQGVYPAQLVNAGDKFESTIQCAAGASGCYVNFRLAYQVDTQPVQVLWSFNEKFEGYYYLAQVDLSSLAGKNVKFILYVSTAGYATGDKAVWIAPRIINSAAPAPTAALTPTSAALTPTVTGAPTNTPTPTMSITSTATPTATETPTTTSTP